MSTLADRVRAGLPNGVRETFDPGGTWGYPVFNTIQDMTVQLVEYVANTIPEFDAIASAMLLRVLPEFDPGGSMVYYANHLMNDNMDSAAENILEFIAADIEDNFRETTMKDSIKGPTPVDIDAAKRRAAIAIFKGIEAAAGKGTEDFPGMFDLATAFKNVSDCVALTNGGAVETNLRNELQAANDEVTQVRGQLATLQAQRDRTFKACDINAESAIKAWGVIKRIIDTLDGSEDDDAVALVETLCAISAEAQKVNADVVPQLDAIRSLLFKSGFHSYDIVDLVETSLEMLAEAQKERDSLGEQLDASEKAREALQAGYDAMAGAHADRLAELGDVSTRLRAELATVKSADTLRHETTRSQLAAVIGAVVDLMAFWHRGNDVYRRAAGTLESHLKTALGDIYQPLVDRERRRQG